MTLKIKTCPCCGGSRIQSFFQLPAMPTVCNQLYSSKTEAEAAQKADQDIAFCSDCTLIYNRAFDERIMSYTSGYDNALHFSPLFEDFAGRLAKRLVDTYKLGGKRVFEIGPGDGYFLELMVRNGVASGKGFDPSAKPDAASGPASNPRIEIVADYFRPGASQIDEAYDALLCRHVLEHIPEPVPFLKEVRSTIGDRKCAVYFEVPNARWILQDQSLWDFIYEHVTYWTETSLETLFRKCGFETVSITTDYDDQFLMIEAYPGAPDPEYLPDQWAADQVGQDVTNFSSGTERLLGYWRDRLVDLRSKQKRGVIWGAGSKGVTFTNIFKDERNAIAHLVDVSDRKVGRFVPGSAIQVIEPPKLADIRPQLVIIANPIYEQEIRQTVLALGIEPDFEAISV